MLVELKQSIVSITRGKKPTNARLHSRIHAKKGDRLRVLFIHHTVKKNGKSEITWYVCNSKHYPKDEVIVFPNQCTVIHEKEKCEIELEQDDLFFGQEEDPSQEEWDKH